MKRIETTIIGLGAALIAGAGIYYVFNKKSKGNAAKSAATPKSETLNTPTLDPARVKSKRDPRIRNLSRVEINQSEAQECNNYVSLPDGIIVVTDKGVSRGMGTVYQSAQWKRRPIKDGRKHRGASGKKKRGNSNLPNHKEMYHLLQKGKSGKLTQEEVEILKVYLKAAKASYDPQEGRKTRNLRHR